MSKLLFCRNNLFHLFPCNILNNKQFCSFLKKNHPLKALSLGFGQFLYVSGIHQRMIGTEVALHYITTFNKERCMMKKILSIATVALFLSAPVFAQEKQEDPGYYGSLTINSDSFFGLTPIAAVGVPLTDNIAITGYAIFWSGIPNSAIGGTGGFGHWTEFGGGVNFSLMDGALNINPQLGILNGTLLSRGGGQAAFNEGMVPNVVVLFEQGGFELELYGGHYIGTKTQTNAKTTPLGVTTHSLVDPDIALLSSVPAGSEALGALQLQAAMFPNKNANYNYTHYWAFPGYQFTDWFSAGGHLEELRFRPTGGGFDEDSTLYSWRGIYLKMKAGKGSLRVAFGDSTATVTSGPSTESLVNAALKGKTVGTTTLTGENAVRAEITSFLTTPRSNGALNGTYYRVTYTQEF
jgi:hypothetical protein